MALKTTLIRNILAAAYAAEATHVALFSTVPGALPGTELPGVDRLALNWSPPVNGTMSDADLIFLGISAGQAVRGFGVFDDAVAGNYLDGAALPEQVYSGPGTYELDVTYTQV